MKALSLWQPYLAGVICGDGWCTRRTLGLRCADEDFARTFARAILKGYGIAITCYQDERGYWLVRARNGTGRFDHLLEFEPKTKIEMAHWIRGLFDSEGNASLCKSKMSKNSWNRRVAIFSTTTKTLDRAAEYLHSLGIVTLRYIESRSVGHKGDRIVHQLRIRPGKENFRLFSEIVGSSIRRKMKALKRMPLTYRKVRA